MTTKIKIRGGRPLEGTLNVPGSKNASLPVLAACILPTSPLVLKKIPALRDTLTMLQVLRQLGAEVVVTDEDGIMIDPTGIAHFEVPYALTKTMRASTLVLGPLLAKYGEAVVSLPGGCAIGSRPVDVHMEAMRALGATLTLENGNIHAKVDGRLKGCHFVMPIVTVGGTENMLMAAVLAEGQTVIKNASNEPEVVGLCDFLNQLGADIQGVGTSTLTINGVASLSGGEYSIIPDRIVAGTLLIGAVMTKGRVRLEGISQELLEALLVKLEEAGAMVTIEKHAITVDMRERELKAVNIQTGAFPAFPTDLQAQLMAMNTVANGVGTITETVFENRFMHVPELKRMGAKIQVEGNTAVVTGQQSLMGAPVMSTDIRASSALVLAGLVAKGETVVDRVYHLDRGYEFFEEQLKRCGADVVRVVAEAGSEAG